MLLEERSTQNMITPKITSGIIFLNCETSQKKKSKPKKLKQLKDSLIVKNMLIVEKTVKLNALKSPFLVGLTMNGTKKKSCGA